MPVQGGEKLVAIDRFGQVIIAPGLQTARPVFGRCICCQRHNSTCIAALSKRLGCFYAVHNRHLHIHKNKVERCRGCKLDGLLAVPGNCNGSPRFADIHIEQALIDFVVFRDQYTAGNGVCRDWLGSGYPAARGVINFMQGSNVMQRARAYR